MITAPVPFKREGEENEQERERAEVAKFQASLAETIGMNFLKRMFKK